MTTAMRILVTNDDGIDAPGLRWLARAAARDGHDVVVAAPVTEASGSSAAMTAIEEHGKIILHKRELTGAKHIPAYAVAASPAYIVLLALAMFTATWPIGVWLRRRSRLMAPFPEVTAAPHRSADQHAHEHGNDCGHPAVPHGDHVDYVHDGHRHAPHGEHYDEH